MPFDFFKDNYISINNFDGALHYPFVFDFKGINALLGAHTVDVLLSGVSPLTLLNAVSLNYVKAFGKCEQDLTPTPTTPVDIVCNNGTIKVRHQSGLPIGYQPYEYITASGTQWLDTGVKLASTDIIEAEFQNSSTTGYGALCGVFALGDSSAFYANGTYYGYDVSNGKVDTGVSVDTAWHTLRFDYANGVITLDGNDTTYTPFVFDNAKNNYLFARYFNNSYGYGFKGSCKRFKVIRNNEVICDLIPVVQLSDDAIGMYDLVNNVFHGNVGTGDFTATNPINDLEIYYDGTAETVTSYAETNITDKLTTGYYITDLGTVTENAGSAYSDLLPVEVGVTYGFTLDSNSAKYIRVHGYDSNGDWQVLIARSPTVNDLNITFTVPTGVAYVRFSGPNKTVVFDAYTGGTATCQPLLSVGTYKDLQNITSGSVTRNVGVKVLTGEESFNILSGGAIRFTVTPTAGAGFTPYCTHYAGVDSSFSAANMPDLSIKSHNSSANNLYVKDLRFATADAFKEYVKSLYNAGTPIIMVYKLDTPTTETVTGQTLTITQGTNIVTAEGSVDDLELEVSYKAYAEITVEEIEAVNTDENVEVIIS